MALQAAVLLFATAAFAVPSPPQQRLSPVYKQPFSVALPVPAIKTPLTSWKNPETGTEIDFFEVTARPFKRKFFPDLPGATDLLGYDGSFPGPTFRVTKGREAVVRVVNGAEEQMNLHLHGSYSQWTAKVATSACTDCIIGRARKLPTVHHGTTCLT
jgi:FtsP/CotA-like multicopper oxidase with cupredoxin domain